MSLLITIVLFVRVLLIMILVSVDGLDERSFCLFAVAQSCRWFNGRKWPPYWLMLLLNGTTRRIFIEVTPGLVTTGLQILPQIPPPLFQRNNAQVHHTFFDTFYEQSVSADYFCTNDCFRKIKRSPSLKEESWFPKNSPKKFEQAKLKSLPFFFLFFFHTNECISMINYYSSLAMSNVITSTLHFGETNISRGS